MTDPDVSTLGLPAASMMLAARGGVHISMRVWTEPSGLLTLEVTRRHQGTKEKSVKQGPPNDVWAWIRAIHEPSTTLLQTTLAEETVERAGQ